MLYAGTVIYLGPGSMLMHGTNTSWEDGRQSKYDYVHNPPLVNQYWGNGKMA